MVTQESEGKARDPTTWITVHKTATAYILQLQRVTRYTPYQMHQNAKPKSYGPTMTTCGACYFNGPCANATLLVLILNDFRKGEKIG